MKMLENLKAPFIEMLEQSISMYKLIGTQYKENPMWFQLKSVELSDNEEDNSLLFESSQCSLWMRIACTTEERMYIGRNFNKAYDYFKNLKYTHIKENHPIIWEELDRAWLNKIDRFLEEYSLVHQ